jgi:hypothetical protein
MGAEIRSWHWANLGSTVERDFWAVDGMMVQVSGFRLAAKHEKA